MLPKNLVETRQIVEQLRKANRVCADLSTGALLLAPSANTLRALANAPMGPWHYTHAAGSDESRREIARHASKTLGVSLGPDETVLTAGATEGVFLSVAAQPRRWFYTFPGWHTFPKMLAIQGQAGVPIELGKLVSTARSASHSDGIFIQSPVNPTGEFTRIDDIIECIDNSAATLLFDCTYYGIATSSTREYFSTIFSHIFSSGLHRHRVSIVFSLSKLFRVPGARLGFVCGDAQLGRRIAQLKSATTLNCPVNLQSVPGELWLEADQESEDVCRFLADQGQWFTAACQRAGLVPSEETGTHFRLFDLGPTYARHFSDLLAAGIVCAPAAEMGMPNCIRVNISADRFTLQHLIDSLSTSLQQRSSYEQE